MLFKWVQVIKSGRAFSKFVAVRIGNMAESLKERQENELEAIQAIFMDDFRDLRDQSTRDQVNQLESLYDQQER